MDPEMAATLARLQAMPNATSDGASSAADSVATTGNPSATNSSAPSAGPTESTETTKTETTKVVYLYDADSTTHPLIGARELKDGEAVPANATEVVPNSDTPDQYWNGTAWVTETVYVSLYDENGHYTYNRAIPKGQPLKPGEEAHLVPQGLWEPIKHLDTDPWWEGTPEEVAMAAMEANAPKPEPTAQEQLNAQTMIEMMRLKQANESQAKINAALMMDNLQLKAAVAKLTAQVATSATPAPAESTTQADLQPQSVSTSASESTSTSASESTSTSVSESASTSASESTSTSVSESTSTIASESTSTSTSESASVSASESQAQPTAPSTDPVADPAPDTTATTAETPVQG